MFVGATIDNVQHEEDGHGSLPASGYGIAVREWQPECGGAYSGWLAPWSETLMTLRQMSKEAPS